MKNIPEALLSHLSSGATSMAYCWKIVRTDGVAMGFTDAPRAVSFEGVTYSARRGFMRSAVETTVDLSGGNLEIQGALDAAGITAVDVRAGVYDGAEIFVFKLNWRTPTMGGIEVARAKMGDASMQDLLFSATILGLAAQLDQFALTEAYSPVCRADLGDSKCRVDLTGFTDTGIVATVTDDKTFTATISTARATGYHSEGRIRFDTGLNAGRGWLEIDVYTSPGGFTLIFDAPFAVQIADEFTVIAGCDKTKATCIAKFANLVNRQAEDDLAGLDSALETPNAS